MGFENSGPFNCQFSVTVASPCSIPRFYIPKPSEIEPGLPLPARGNYEEEGLNSFSFYLI